MGQPFLCLESTPTVLWLFLLVNVRVGKTCKSVMVQSDSAYSRLCLFRVCSLVCLLYLSCLLRSVSSFFLEYPVPGSRRCQAREGMCSCPRRPSVMPSVRMSIRRPADRIRSRYELLHTILAPTPTWCVCNKLLEKAIALSIGGGGSVTNAAVRTCKISSGSGTDPPCAKDQLGDTKCAGSHKSTVLLLQQDVEEL